MFWRGRSSSAGSEMSSDFLSTTPLEPSKTSTQQRQAGAASMLPRPIAYPLVRRRRRGPSKTQTHQRLRVHLARPVAEEEPSLVESLPVRFHASHHHDLPLRCAQYLCLVLDPILVSDRYLVYRSCCSVTNCCSGIKNCSGCSSISSKLLTAGSTTPLTSPSAGQEDSRASG